MSWQVVRGHEVLVEAFDQVVRRGRLAHAYLFTGPAGIGKRLFAGELAKALLCESPGKERLEACDRCAACTLVEAGTHPDLASAGRPEEGLEVPIEVVRQLCRFLDLKPARAPSPLPFLKGTGQGRGGKIVILDDGDDLNDAAANCFLKTLEEPPPGALLILIGTSADRQLPTIVSRCQAIHFKPLPETLVAELLWKRGVEDEGFIQRLVRLSGGSLGKALALADSALWDFRRTLLESLAQPQLDSVALAQEWTRFIEEAGKDSASQRRRAALVLHLLIDFLNDALGLSVGGTPRLEEPGDFQLLQRLVKQNDPDQLVKWLERCLEADAQIDRKVQLVLVVEALLDALAFSPWRGCTALL